MKEEGILSVDNLRAETFEGNFRLEELLDGMDSVIQRLDRSCSCLEKGIKALEGQLAVLALAWSESPQFLTDLGASVNQLHGSSPRCGLRGRSFKSQSLAV